VIGLEWWWNTVSRGGDNKEGQTDDQLGHRRKHSGEHRHARARDQTLTGTTKKKTQENKRPTNPVLEKHKDEPNDTD
jgi:hypothetical protein